MGNIIKIKWNFFKKNWYGSLSRYWMPPAKSWFQPGVKHVPEEAAPWKMKEKYGVISHLSPQNMPDNEFYRESLSSRQSDILKLLKRNISLQYSLPPRFNF